MAPRRNAMGFNGVGHFADLFGPSPIIAHNNNNGVNMNIGCGTLEQQNFIMNTTSQDCVCCVPTGDCLMRSLPVRPDDFRAGELYVKVTCVGGCAAGQYMHRECYDNWDRLVTAYLKGGQTSRAPLDLWSNNNNNSIINNNNIMGGKKGMDMAVKASTCRCGSGFLKRDQDWPAAVQMSTVRRQSLVAVDQERSSSSKKKKRRQNQQQKQPSFIDFSIGELRLRTGSLSSNGSSSPLTGSSSSTNSVSPAHSGSFAATGSKRRVKDVFERQSSMNGNGIFCRRLDFGTFNRLPRHMLNSYHVKIEDEGNHGNDETRSFILSSLAAQNQSRVNCVLCSDVMLVFDRYPLVDGTFFLSPKQYSKNAVEVKNEGRALFLNAVCMKCLDGKDADRKLCCRFCSTQWDGTSLIMGTMYSYDVFAAMPCCNERLKCNSCQKAMMMPHQRLNFYSDYSRKVTCPHCSVVDYHFVKPLALYYTRQWP
ncbi:headcase protein [Adelges cooleyi]|uniref:headcase protein n=1 Tax=Adelges cooleyi TaxID=133065 RepID=UPI00217F7FCD|nr:headcase protein [Adelges cooleyi]XP_050427907.1 headcase protein [Adelges cooleyi]